MSLSPGQADPPGLRHPGHHRGGGARHRGGGGAGHRGVHVPPAFLLARKIEAIVPGDPTGGKHRLRFAGEFTRHVLPAGAEVLARPRTGGEADWVELGEARGKPVFTPLGYSVFKVQSPGLEPREFAMIVSEFKSKLPDMPGAIVLVRRDERLDTLDLSYWDYLVNDGRAVLYPILKGTFERGGGVDLNPDLSEASCIPQVKDIFRSLDCLETRSDIQKDHIGYLGFSWGANASPIVCAVEKRIKAAVLLGGGLYDPVLLGFASRCSTPTLMMNGRQDGYAERQAPLFRSLGAPADRKRHVVFDADHSLAGLDKDIIRVNLEWFDKYLGKVR